MKTAYGKFTLFLENYCRDLPLLAMRLILAWNFVDPALRKYNHFGDIVEWFGEMGLPAPGLMAFLATTTEILVFILLPLGLGTRFIAVPGMVTMLVAIFAVHWEDGYSGFEVPFLYFGMFFTLFIYGAGRLSLDYLLGKKLYGKPAA